MKFPVLFSLGIILSTLCATAAPREWTDQASGRKITAEFVSVQGDQVTLSINGKEYKLPVAKLSAEDQAYLKIVGDAPAPSPTAEMAKEEPATEKSTAKVMGPVDAEGSHYFYYIPASLKPGMKAPLVFYTGSGGGSAGTVKRMVEGAEISGWIAACSVELRNGMADEEYPKQTDRCLKSLYATLPIDTNQVYFSGNSGGARVAYTSAKRENAAGVLAVIAGGQDDEMSKSRNYFMVSGSTDYNRYDTSNAFAAVRKTSAFRFHPGPHEDGPDWLLTEGIVWLQAVHFEKAKTPVAERAGYEDAVTAWIKRLRANTPYRAAWWADFFRTRITGPRKAEIEALATELVAVPENASYIKGIADLETFAETVFGTEDRSLKPGHTTPEIQRKADKILQDHSDAPWIKEIATALKNPVIGTKKK